MTPLQGILASASDIKIGTADTTQLFGILTINTWDVLSTLLAAGLVLLLGFIVRARITAGVPGRLQLAFETISDAVNTQVDSSIGEKGKRVVPLAMTLFLLILFCNWLEMIPTGHNPQYLPAPTGDVNFTYALAHHRDHPRARHLDQGPGARAATSATTSGRTRCCLPINIIEEIAKPITLALRLFGNIFSGRIMLLLICGALPGVHRPDPVLDAIWKMFDGCSSAPSRRSSSPSSRSSTSRRRSSGSH